jgi:hypothetical protein
MAIKRYYANKDTIITNAFEPNLITRGTGSNMGASDILEVFSIYGQMISSGSTIGFAKTQELSRVLIQWEESAFKNDRVAGIIPPSGSARFFLRLFNAKHSQTTPTEVTYNIVPVSSSWQEGYGMDIDNYTDLTKGGPGADWIQRREGSNWTTIGGNYLDAHVKTQTLTKANQDIEVDITDIIENWINTKSGGGYDDYGLGIHLTASQEAYFSSSAGINTGSSLQNPNGATRSYYTKKFFGRNSQFFFKRPIIEVRWDSSMRDDRGTSFYSSSFVPAADNLNNFMLYNYVNGQLKSFGAPYAFAAGATIPPVFVKLFSGSTDNTVPTGSALTVVTSTSNVASNSATVISGGFYIAPNGDGQLQPNTAGIYTASFAITASSTPLTRIFDVWYLNESGVPGAVIYTGSFAPTVYGVSNVGVQPEYVFNISNLKDEYLDNENPRLRLSVREKNWNPSIYTVANASPQSYTLENVYYRVTREIDGLTAITFGTGSITPQTLGTAGSYTRLSYDASGSYFDLDMSLLEPGYSYQLGFAYYNNNGYTNVKNKFKFRVEEDLNG